MPLLRLLIALSLCFAAHVARAECSLGDVGALPERNLVHLPATRAAAEPMPLVILLHGSTGTGADMLRDSHLAGTADRHGFVVVAPDGGIAAGRGFVWNIPGVPTVTGVLPPEGARDDVAYLSDLVDRLVATGCVDAGRVYVTGLSGGGRMASWLGCVAAPRFAAMAPVVGLRAGRPLASDPAQADAETCRASVPLPLLAFAGDADTTNPIAGGGAPYWQYPQSAALQRWAALNGCSEPYARNLSATVYEQGYARCENGATVAARVTRGGQHSWSVVDNEAMWAFLSRHRR
ncbi:alpha/beta hydrolase family esterase [Sphingomonas desiccabilis]|uniref:Polyhydroxybutyrate depolymerase n=1 Tax=Sphingomonas desiccabilis TaxID=429134 RepID=A0A4Q2IZB2_9SPHN|nr:PHB depolymerase family esterase [Sphingomonas desiccabilis]MBB3909662.1 polyhydroxybutyrate depolymerase [Sphingomonas desiccabilis]RXZ34362.1 polyhydroxybutyrate depolymerase [Sphingomonas desiccabilis]